MHPEEIASVGSSIHAVSLIWKMNIVGLRPSLLFVSSRLLFHPPSQPARLIQQSHAVHKVLERHNSHQPLLIHHWYQAHAARCELVESGTECFCA